jgi:hypothetical protein
VDGYLALRHGSRKNRMTMAAFIVLLFCFGRFFIIGALLWCVWVWPMMKVYEAMIIGDLKAQAGEIGAHRGGFLGYRTWPRKVRLGLFGAILAAFWGGIAFGIYTLSQLPSDRISGPAWAGGFLVVTVIPLCWLLIALSRRPRSPGWWATWQRRRRFKRLDATLHES